MIQTILALIAAILTTTAPATETRTITGTYYDYMVVEGNDGNDYLIDNPKDYFVYDEVYQDYLSVFKEGDPVEAVLDTKGTDDMKDDVVIKVRSIEQ